MAFSTMHFAVGMGCTALAAIPLCMSLKRGWRWIPLAMSLGGTFACIPDMPRVFREDLPRIPFITKSLASHSLENTLMQYGDVFFFHSQLDNQPHEYALHGLLLILLFYNGSIIFLLRLEKQTQKKYWQTQAYAKHAHRQHQKHTQNTGSNSDLEALHPPHPSHPLPTHSQGQADPISPQEEEPALIRKRIRIPYRERRQKNKPPRRSTGHLRKSA